MLSHAKIYTLGPDARGREWYSFMGQLVVAQQKFYECSTGVRMGRRVFGGKKVVRAVSQKP